MRSGFCAEWGLESEKSIGVGGRLRAMFPRVSRSLENLCLWTEKSVIRDTNGVAESEIA